MRYKFEIRLLSDGEPASGLGCESLNGILPRNEHGRICVPASQLKGLMRENFRRYLSPFLKEKSKLLEGMIFGRAGDEEDGGCPSLMHLQSASVKDEDCKTLVVQRTAVNELGLALEHSLRAREAIAAGSILYGEVLLDSDDEWLNRILRFCLLSIRAIGGSRTRGAGRCRVVISGGEEKETPGGILRELVSNPFSVPSPASLQNKKDFFVSKVDWEEDVMALRLDFEATSPLLLPEHPVGKSNVISSGFVIPATAVAGALLTKLSQYDSDLAKACYEAKRFRCFPLLPVAEGIRESIQLPVYVSNTQKVSKLTIDDNGNYQFGDTMIPDGYLEESYQWQKKSANISMKGVDGVLYMFRDDDRIGLMKRKSIPTLYQAHAVVNGDGSKDSLEKKDNLFTTEAICVKYFSGLILLPKQLGEILKRLFEEGEPMSFGKARSLHGSGIMKVVELGGSEHFFQQYHQVRNLRNRLFIVQSPVVFTLDDVACSTKEALGKVLQQAGWGEVEKESVMTSVQFGWNQTVKANRVGSSCRTKAQRVILPGSVFLLKNPIPERELNEKLVRGIGEAMYAGFGAVLPHPMFGTKLFSLENEDEEIPTFPAHEEERLVCLGYELWEKGKNLSASQVARLMNKWAMGSQAAFLEEQLEKRPVRIRELWKPLKKILSEELGALKKSDAMMVLRVWHDLLKGGNEA